MRRSPHWALDLGVPTGGSQRGVAKVLNNPRVFGAYAYLDDCYWALIRLPTNIAGMGPAAARMMAPLRNFGARRVCQEPSFDIQGRARQALASALAKDLRSIAVARRHLEARLRPYTAVYPSAPKGISCSPPSPYL